MNRLLRGREAAVAEFLGTFLLVFCGTGALAAGGRMPGSVGTLIVALAHGLALMLGILLWGGRSGGHFNPAVTLGLHLSGRFPKDRLAPYLAAQLLGGIAASLTVKLLTHSPNLGETGGPLAWWQAWGVEFVGTAILMSAVLYATDESSQPPLPAAVIIGGALTLVICWAGPLTGASLNPARSLGPALAGWHFGALWIYLTAPVAGAWAACGLRRRLG